jgi:uncharacterized protein YjbI with pentapeptide repeats
LPASPEEHRTASGGRRVSLRADCERCFGLCCVVPAFSASADFAIGKAAGQPCSNLGPEFRCSIHGRLRQQGFPGCTVYDCFGAGQQVAQVTFGGQDWRRTPDIAERMFAVFTVMRQLHELLWYLGEALTMRPARSLHGELRAASDETERLTHDGPDALMGLEVDAQRRDAGTVLRRASELARAGARRADVDLTGADLIGKDLRGADLTARKLRPAPPPEAASRSRQATGRGQPASGAVAVTGRTVRLIAPRQLLAAQIDLTTLGTGYIREAHGRFLRMQEKLNSAGPPPSVRVIDEYIALTGRDYRLETEAPHPVEALREGSLPGRRQ